MTLPEIRFSHLRAFGRSPMHGQLALRKDQEPIVAMQRGSALHAIVFGTKRVCAYPGAQRRGKEYEAFAAANSDADILTAAEYEKASRMADAVRQSKLAAPLLQGVIEKTLRFRWNGLECRATPDVRGENFITELKSSATSDPMRFPWTALRMHYHAQMRMQAIPCDPYPLDSYVVCVEASEPFPVTVFRIDEKALEAGEKLLVLWSERLKNCTASEHYPPYSDCIVPIDLPETDADLVFGEDE